jgi:hypothetical protein
VGATGARRYEIFARAVSMIDENGDWFRLMGDAHDAVAERIGRMTFEDTDIVRELMGFFGTTEQWQVCFQSCSANDTCSECSDPLTLRFNATGGPSALQQIDGSNSRTSPRRCRLSGGNALVLLATRAGRSVAACRRVSCRREWWAGVGDRA